LPLLIWFFRELRFADAVIGIYVSGGYYSERCMLHLVHVRYAGAVIHMPQFATVIKPTYIVAMFVLFEYFSLSHDMFVLPLRLYTPLYSGLCLLMISIYFVFMKTVSTHEII